MAVRGRKPKPTAIKVLEGNPGRRPLNDAEPQFEQANTRVPSGRLSEDGKRIWRALARPLAEAGVLTDADLFTFEMMCEHYAVAREARVALQRDGTYVDSYNGPKKHPAASVWRENSMAFKAYATEFGLTPSSRVRLKVDGNEKTVSLAEMLFTGVDGDGVDLD